MRSAIINQYGDPTQFAIASDIPEPVPARNQVKIRVKAAGINPLDFRIRNGELTFFLPSRFPMILGNDAAGIVTEVGKDVTRFSVGDRVFGFLDANIKPSWRGFAQPGSYADYAVSREDTLAHMPENVDFLTAAATPLAALTAYEALHTTVTVTSGQRILINGASGGVGTFAVQIAKAMGLWVTAVCSTKKIERLRALGVDDFIDYTLGPLGNTEKRFDIVYDVVANQSFVKLKHLLTPGGSYLSNVASMSTIASGLLGKYFSALGYRQRNHHVWVRPSSEDLSVIAGLMSKRLVTPVIDDVFPLEKVSLAHGLLESGRVTGKLVLDLADR